VFIPHLHKQGNSVFKEIVREIIWGKENVFFFSNSSPFPSDDVFAFMLLCFIVIVRRGFRAEFMEVQIAEALLTDSDSSSISSSSSSRSSGGSSSRTCVTISVTIKNTTKGRISFFHCT
jgi:hypothetical protein